MFYCTPSRNPPHPLLIDVEQGFSGIKSRKELNRINCILVFRGDDKGSWFDPYCLRFF
jgi:hypothetical protein